jgi:hypothetical protein
MTTFAKIFPLKVIFFPFSSRKIIMVLKKLIKDHHNYTFKKLANVKIQN